MTKIFVSYARNDKRKVRGILKQLTDHGMDAWLDTTDIPTGANWPKEITKAILSCQTVLLFMSASSMASDNVRREVQIAFDNKKEIIILRLDDARVSDALQYQLASIQWTDYSAPDWKPKLVAALLRKNKLKRKPSPSTDQKRRFEAAMPDTTKVNQDIQIYCMISTEGLPGLRAKLPGSAKINELSKKDVTGSDVSLRFHRDEKSRQLLPLHLFLAVSAPDFIVKDLPKKIQLLPRDATVEFNFLVSPKVSKQQAHVVISLYLDEDKATLIGSVGLSTRVLGWQDTAISVVWWLASLPLNFALLVSDRSEEVHKSLERAHSDEPILKEPTNHNRPSTARRGPMMELLETELRTNETYWIVAKFDKPADDNNLVARYFASQNAVIQEIKQIIGAFRVDLESPHLWISLREVMQRLKNIREVLTARTSQILELLNTANLKTDGGMDYMQTRLLKIIYAIQQSTMEIEGSLIQDLPAEYPFVSPFNKESGAMVRLYLELHNLELWIEQLQDLLRRLSRMD